MNTYDEHRRLHAHAVAQTAEFVQIVDETAFDLRTPCVGWDVRELLRHMIGQNDGFALAVETGDAPGHAYRAAAPSCETLVDEWARSATRLIAAFQVADPRARIRLRELPAERSVVRIDTALGMQLLDTAVHAWDLAAALGRPYTPLKETVRFVLDYSRAISQSGAASAAFAASVPTGSKDLWTRALASLGRSPEWRRAAEGMKDVAALP